MERPYPNIEVAHLALPVDDWPRHYRSAISAFFEPLRGHTEVMLGYAGVNSDDSFNLDVVMIWQNLALDRRIIYDMDEVGKTLGFQRHKSSLVHASLEEIDELERGLKLRGEFPFIPSRLNGWVRRNGVNGSH